MTVSIAEGMDRYVVFRSMFPCPLPPAAYCAIRAVDPVQLLCLRDSMQGYGLQAKLPRLHRIQGKQQEMKNGRKLEFATSIQPGCDYGGAVTMTVCVTVMLGSRVSRTTGVSFPS